MGIALWHFVVVCYRVLWPAFLLFAYQLRESLPNDWEQWLANQEWMLPFAIGGSIIWIVAMVLHEAPGIREAYEVHLRPRISFQVKEISALSTGITKVGNRRTVDEVTMVILGHFTNEGGMPSTVISIETSLVKQVGFLKLPMSHRSIAVAFRESRSGELINERGYYIGPFSRSPEIDMTAAASIKGRISYENLNDSYQIRIQWRALGQGVKETFFTPDWRAFKKIAEDHLDHPSPFLSAELEEKLNPEIKT